MTPLQLAALAHPCRTPDDRRHPRHVHQLRVGPYVVTVVLTLDVGRAGDFLPPEFARREGAWHASAEIRERPPAGWGVGTDAAFPIPTAVQSRPEAEIVRRALLDALDGVGIAPPVTWWASVTAVHCWRGLTGHERDPIAPAPAPGVGGAATDSNA